MLSHDNIGQDTLSHGGYDPKRDSLRVRFPGEWADFCEDTPDDIDFVLLCPVPHQEEDTPDSDSCAECSDDGAEDTVLESSAEVFAEPPHSNSSNVECSGEEADLESSAEAFTELPHSISRPNKDSEHIESTDLPTATIGESDSFFGICLEVSLRDFHGLIGCGVCRTPKVYRARTYKDSSPKWLLKKFMMLLMSLCFIHHVEASSGRSTGSRPRRDAFSGFEDHNIEAEGRALQQMRETFKFTPPGTVVPRGNQPRGLARVQQLRKNAEKIKGARAKELERIQYGTRHNGLDERKKKDRYYYNKMPPLPARERRRLMYRLLSAERSFQC